MKLEFTSTECVRPEINDISYSSFRDNLTGIDFDNSILYLNIDPIPDDRDPLEVVEVARRYFGKVEYNIAHNPNFCAAIKYVWSKPTAPIFFHLEADWILHSKIDIRDIISNLYNDNVISVNLRAYKPIPPYICLSPGVHKTEYIKEIAQRLDIRYNPERQIRPKSELYPEGGALLNDKGSIHYPDNVIISDIGRAWINESAVQKYGDKEFNRWVYKTGSRNIDNEL